MTRWTMLIAVLLLGACHAEPEGQQWLVVEVDEGLPDVDMGAPDPDVAIPPAPDIPPPQLLGDSSPCTAGDECASGTCLTGNEFPNGYCTATDCASGSVCAEGSACRQGRDGPSYCAPLCTSDNACGDGLACRYDFRTGDRMCRPISGAADGEACVDRRECQNRWCQPDLTGGYCVTFGCETSDDCSNQREFDNVCLNNGGGFNNFCVRRCDTVADCRPDHLCTDIGGGETVCLEDPARPFEEAVFEPSALNIQCGIPVENGLARITYDIADTTTSYMVTPMARDGQPMQARRIKIPDGSEKNFVAERDILAYPSRLFASMSPTLVPASPTFMDMLAPGTNEYHLAAEGTEVCYYLLEKDAPGNVLDMNIYLVGVPGVTAATAGTDPRFVGVFDEVRRIYAQIGIELGVLRFFDMDEATNVRYGVLRSSGDVASLTKLSQAPGVDLESLLSVNVFFVGEFALGGGAIGISSGLPGPAGLHGTQGSGVVFTAEYMGTMVPDAIGGNADGNAYTALLLAHEVGHWLGLYHTTETDSSTHDPLGDTPQCGTVNNNPQSCASWGNLMFPYAGASNTNVTADQGFVLKGNPAVRTVVGVTP